MQKPIPPSDYHVAAIQTAAHHVAQAMAEHARTSEVLVEADEECERIRGRLDEKAIERDALIRRRQAGDVRDDDAGTLMLIEADKESLMALLAEAERAMSVLHTPRQAAAQVLEGARQALRAAEAAAEEDAVARYAAELDAALLDAIRRLETIRGGKGGRPAWGASPALRDALRRLAAQRGDL